MTINLDSKIPDGPMADKWSNYVAGQKLVNPSNKRKFKIIVVGTGLAGASAAATLGELGYQVEAFTFHDSPRRAHSIAATAFTACSTTRSRAATSALAKQTCIVLPKCRSTSLTRWLPRVCRLHASTAACSTIAASAAPK